jgi:UPF0716 protein FxsA
MVKWIIVAILLLPVVEIAVFIVVASLLGLLWALVLMLATTFAGFLVLRQAGRGKLARFRVAVGDRDMTGIEANTSGFLTVLAGILLVLPGFVTDLIGAVLLIRPVRRWCGATFRHAVQGRERARGPGAVVDLAPDEWARVRDRELEGKRKEPGGD